MRKLFSVLALVALLATLLVPTAYAAGTATVTGSNETAAPGAEVTLTVTMAGNTGFFSGKTILSYDTSVLTLKSINTDGYLFNGATTNTDAGIASFASAKNVTANGTLLTATFTVAKTAKDGVYNVDIAVKDMVNGTTYKPLTVNTKAGRITVVTPHVCTLKPVAQVDATCTTPGTKAHYKCDGCDKLYADAEGKNEVTAVDLVIQITDHSYGDWKVVKEATETETGVREKVCTCGHKITESIPLVPHTHKYTAVVTKPTHVQKGYTTYTCSCGHSYVDENSYVDALGHEYSDWKVIKEATETEPGLREKECSCGDKITEVIPVIGHVHKYTETVTAPTHEEKGYTTYTCSCGHSYVDENSYVDALGHEYSDWKVIKEATETETGLREKECSCGDKITEEIPVVGHEHIYTPVVVDPTHDKEGYTTYVCTCGDKYVDEDSYVEAVGHSYGDWVVIKEATATEPGLREKICECGEKITEEIPATGETSEDTDNPTTGVDSMLWLWIVLLCVSSAGVVGYTLYRRKTAQAAR